MNPKNNLFRKFFFVFVPLLFVYVAGSYYFSSQIIDFKPRPLEEDRIRLKKTGFSDFGLPRAQDISFQNDGIDFHAWYFENPKPKPCGVLLVHGYTSTRWGVLKYAPIFWKRGCSIFTYDHRRHGESGGRFGTFGFHEKFDMQTALHSFTEVSGLPPEKIGVLGESLGAATAIQSLSMRGESAFLIAESPYKDLDSIVGKKAVELYGGWVGIFVPLAYKIAEWRADFRVSDVSPIEMAKNLKIPVLIIHSNTDDYTPYEHSVAIEKNLPPSITKKLVLTDWNASHARSIDKNYDGFEAIVLEFFREAGLDQKF